MKNLLAATAALLLLTGCVSQPKNASDISLTRCYDFGPEAKRAYHVVFNDYFLKGQSEYMATRWAEQEAVTHGWPKDMTRLTYGAVVWEVYRGKTFQQFLKEIPNMKRQCVAYVAGFKRGIDPYRRIIIKTY